MIRPLFVRLAAVALVAVLVPAIASAQAVKTKSSFITTSDGVKIHYLEAGQVKTTGQFSVGSAGTKLSNMRQQPAILFVPGWTMPAWIWERQIDHVSKTHRVVAMDPRGQGESSKPIEGYTPASRARDIKTVVDGLKLAPVVLVGWSMGVGEVVSYVDQFGTKDIAGIVLVDGIAGMDPNSQFPPFILNLAGNFLKEREKFTQGFVRSMYKKPQPEPYIQKVMDASKQTPSSAGVALIIGMFTTDNRPALAKIDKPTLLCTAPGSPLDAVYDDMQKRIPGSRHEIFEGAGHALFVDDAEKFNSLLDAFLRNLAQD